MNVSELSDVELNRAMIWLYPLWGSIWMVDQTGDQMIERKGWINRVDYLTDWNLTMPLAFENGLSIKMPDIDFDLTGAVTKYLTGTTDLYCDFIGTESPLRAICEVLVMIKMESK